MSIGYTDSKHYEDIAYAIRSKTGKTDQLSPAEMATEIASIETGGTGENYLADYVSGQLTELNDTNCGNPKAINATFSNNSRIQSIDLKHLETVQAEAFTNMQGLKSVNLPALKSIGNSALFNKSAITSLTLPSFEKAGYNGILLDSCNKLEYLSLPSLTVYEGSIVSYGPLLKDMQGLKKLYLENLERVGSGTDSITSPTLYASIVSGGYLVALNTACFPKLKYQTGGKLGVCEMFKTACYPQLKKQIPAKNYANYPVVEYYNSSTAKDCVIYVPKLESFSAYFTNNARNMSLTLVIGDSTSTSPCVLSGGVYLSGSNTPTSLEIFVPDHLFEEYKTATNWALHADSIKPQSEMTSELWQRINDAMTPPIPPEEATA